MGNFLAFFCLVKFPKIFQKISDFFLPINLKFQKSQFRGTIFSESEIGIPTSIIVENFRLSILIFHYFLVHKWIWHLFGLYSIESLSSLLLQALTILLLFGWAFSHCTGKFGSLRRSIDASAHAAWHQAMVPAGNIKRGSSQNMII